MRKQLNLVGAVATLLAAMAVSPAFAQSPGGTQEHGGQMIFNARMMKVMDTNKDGMVSRDEYMTYMGKQYDMMDVSKKGMMTPKEFMDKKMMAQTFRSNVE